MESVINEIKNIDKNSTFIGDDQVGDPSIVEKYDRFLQEENFDDVADDSDVEYFPGELNLREEYDKLKRDSSEKANSANSSLLSKGLPGKLQLDELNCSQVEISDVKNGITTESREDKDERSGLATLKKLIEQLQEVRICGPEGNSIFCQNLAELETIQERYGKILDFIREKSSTFERNDSTSTQQENDEDNVNFPHNSTFNTSEINLDRESLNEHLQSVEEARDKYYIIEQQVRELIEQLELVERYKMESL